jgi:hypothetical protein
MARFTALVILAAVAIAATTQAATPIDLAAGLSASAAGAVTELRGSPGAAAPTLFSRVPSRGPTTLTPDLARAPGRTTIDYRLTKSGLFTELGYFCLGGDPYAIPHEAAVVAGAQDGRRVGAALRYPFN